MKKKSLFLVLIIIIFLVISYVFFIVHFNGDNNSKKHISKIIEIDIEKCNIEIESDTHGGFLGDGDYFAKIICSNKENHDDFYNWKEMPLSDSLKKVMGMSQCDDKECSNAFEKYSIPEIENGYYYFLDRHSEATDKHDDANLNNRDSMNFSLAIYDADNKIIYFYEMDT